MSHPVPVDLKATGDGGPGDPRGGDGPGGGVPDRGAHRFDSAHSRVTNQQLFMRAVSRTVLTPETLTNPGRICGVVTERFPCLTVDDSLSAEQMVGLGRTLTGIRRDDIDPFTLPANGVGRARGQSVVSPDGQAIEPSTQH